MAKGKNLLNIRTIAPVSDDEIYMMIMLLHFINIRAIDYLELVVNLTFFGVIVGNAKQLSKF